jgi:hypothetical protein
MTDTTVVTDAPVVVSAAARTRTAAPVNRSGFEINTDSQSGNTVVTFTSNSLIQIMRDAANLEGMYDRKPQQPMASLFDELGSLQEYASTNPKNAQFNKLISAVQAHYKSELDRVNTMTSQGVINFDGLRLLLRPGTDVVLAGSQPQGATIVSTEYRASFFGVYLEVTYEYVTSNGAGFYVQRDETRIDHWRGVRPIAAMEVMPITDSIRAELAQRGAAYVKLALGAHYKQNQGSMDVRKWYYWTPMRASGRIMVDIATHNQFKSGSSRDGRLALQQTVDPDRLWMTDAHVYGFSFVTKQWGRFAVTTVSDIEFRKDAYDQLVMDPAKKSMIRALVEDSSSGFADIISGKGGGCIFLLHGEPGVGKTLTAEAVSELLERPLYSVSVGELGVTAEALEASLRQILDVAQIWNAVILIDEADIFLEKRGIGDVVRNSLCSVFLRLLEYHQGVLFLTTNRVREFDSAFHSRISVALKYGSLDTSARETVWVNLLAAAGITGLNTAALSKVKINGRQIKNTIRLAQGLARQQGVPVTVDHIQTCLDVSAQFARDLQD